MYRRSDEQSIQRGCPTRVVLALAILKLDVQRADHIVVPRPQSRECWQVAARGASPLPLKEAVGWRCTATPGRSYSASHSF